MQGFAEFEFDPPRALTAELVGLLHRMGTAPLEPDVTQGLPEQPARPRANTIHAWPTFGSPDEKLAENDERTPPTFAMELRQRALVAEMKLLLARGAA